MKKTFTVIGTYWDNNQGWSGDFEALDEADAISQAQTEVKAGLTGESQAEGDQAEEDTDDEQEGPLRIIAVLEGPANVLFLCNAE